MSHPAEVGYISSPIAEGLANTRRAQQALTEISNSIIWELTEIDRQIGAPRPGQLVVVGARSGNGKTTFLLNWMNCLHDSLEYRTCYIGTEMGPQELYRKWAAMRLYLDEDAVLANEWNKLPQEARLRVEGDLHFLGLESDRTWLPECYQPTTEQVLDIIRRADEEFRADVVIFDHLHRLRTKPGQSEREALVEVSAALKTLATERQMLVVVASQLKREEHGVFDRYRPPHLGSFMGSSAIEGNADIALALFRPLKPMTQKQERAIRSGALSIKQFVREGVMAVKCVKHRFRGRASDTTVFVLCRDGRVEDLEMAGNWEEINREDRLR